MTDDSIWPIDLTFPVGTLVIAGNWCRLNNGRIQTRILRHELDLVLRLTGSIPGLAQERLAAARKAPAPIVIPPEPPAPPDPPAEPLPDAVEVGDMDPRTGQLVLL